MRITRKEFERLIRNTKNVFINTKIVYPRTVINAYAEYKQNSRY